MGRTLILTVDRLIGTIAISTGFPATVIADDCPRTIDGASAMPAPAAANPFNARRLVIGMRE